MRLGIRGYLECRTNQTDLWINLRELYDAINPHDSKGIITDEQVEKGVLFAEMLTEMVNGGEIRMNKNGDGSFSVALESYIQEIINSTKKSAIDEMKEELQKYVDSENYEKAAEYRDMINNYKDI